jgi:peptidoglycan hydrolase-like protein with peptidoglycan-binding domain
MKRLGATTLLVAMLAISSSAAAATATTTKQKLVGGSMTLQLPDAFWVNRNPVIVPNRYIHVHGVVRPYVKGQKVLVRAYLGPRLMERDYLWIRRSKNGNGYFNQALLAGRAGDVLVQVTHAKNTAMKGFDAQRRYQVLSENVGFGSTGPFVQLIQARLRALHFYLIESGVYDSFTGLAIDAYHRLLGFGTSQNLDPTTIRYLLNGWGAFHVRYPSQGKHAEGDLADQVLALINGSQVYALYPISSGKPSTPTVLGNFHVYSKVPGYLPDGMFFSNFFTGGYAIHGYNPAPDYPASHGCMRLPIQDAISVYNWLQIGNGVDTYY